MRSWRSAQGLRAAGIGVAVLVNAKLAGDSGLVSQPAID